MRVIGLRVSIHPFVFLAGAVLVSALWLWRRPTLPAAMASGASGRTSIRVERPSISFDAVALERYVGTYEGRQSFTVELTLENGRLFANSPGVMVPFEMLPTSETKFFLKDAGVDVEFRIENGVVKGLAANTELGVVLMERVP
jgi:hypothetical protein